MYLRNRLKQFNQWKKPLTNGLHLSSKEWQANLGLREQLENCIPMAHRHLMLGSNEKDFEWLLQFSLGPAFDLHLLQSLPSYLCSKMSKGEAKCSSLELTRTWSWPWRHHSRIWNSHPQWVYNTIFSNCWPVLAKEWGQKGKKTQM